jgi:hypothetical protein
LYADAIDALVSAGIWAKLDALYLFAAPDSSTALTNLKSSSFGITAVSAPDFTADRGFNSDDGTGYLDTGFNPTSGSPHFTQNSACVFAWNRTNPGSVAPADAIGYVSGAAGLRIYVNFSGQTYFACNSNSSSNESSPSTTIALFSVNRTDSSNSQLYRNGTDVDDFPETSSAPNNENIVFLKGESGIANSAWELSAGGIGSSLNSTEQGELYDALLPYLQAVGAV